MNPIKGAEKYSFGLGKIRSCLVICSFLGRAASRITTGGGKVAVVSAKSWDRRSRDDIIKSTTPCHEAEMIELGLGSNPACLLDCSGCKIRGNAAVECLWRLTLAEKSVSN